MGTFYWRGTNMAEQQTIMGMLSQTSENEVEILLSKDIKKRDFKNIVKLNTAHMTYSLK